MKFLLFANRRVLCVCLALLLPQALLADQTDPQLDDYFLRLKFTDSPREIRELENLIWASWLAHPNPDVERLMSAATARMNSGAFSQALRIYSQLIESYPNFAEAWNKRATLYYVLEDFAASVADIEATLALEPRHFGALSGLGLVYIQQGELDKARDAFVKLLEVHPNSANAQQNLERIENELRLNVI